MTANNFFENALALIVTDREQASDYAPFAAQAINILLCETFDVNNSLRDAAGLPPLTTVPFISSLDDEVQCEDKLIYSCLVYGLCGKLLAEDDIQKAVYFQNMYVNGADECGRVTAAGIIDVYR